MKTNIITTTLFASLTIVLLFALHRKESGATIAALTGLCILLFVCSLNLLIEDIQHANKRRKRRAMAVKMTGYSELRSGAWIKD